MNKKFLISITLLLLLAVTPGGGQATSVYDRIQKRGQITIGVAGDYPPLKYEKNGKQVGVEIELARGIADLLSVKPVFKTVNVNDFIPRLASGDVDLVLASLSRNVKRARQVWFSVPYLQITPAVLTDQRVLPQTEFGDEFEEAPIRTIWDLKRLSQFTFVARKGTVYEGLLKSSFSDKNIKLVTTHQEALKTLFDRKADGYVHDSVLLEYQYSKSSDWKSKYALLSGGDHFEALCAAMPFGAVKLKNQVDLFIEESMRLKKIDKWMRKYSK